MFCRGFEVILPPSHGHIRRDDDKCKDLKHNMILTCCVSATHGQHFEGPLTPPTIHRSAVKPLYSTPPSSSNCSLVKRSNLEFRPTTASKEIYDTALEPGMALPYCEAKVCVRGIVIVLVNFRCNFGKNRLKILEIILCGIGNPPKPLSLVRIGG